MGRNGNRAEHIRSLSFSRVNLHCHQKYTGKQIFPTRQSKIGIAWVYQRGDVCFSWTFLELATVWPCDGMIFPTLSAPLTAVFIIGVAMVFMATQRPGSRRRLEGLGLQTEW